MIPYRGTRIVLGHCRTCEQIGADRAAALMLDDAVHLVMARLVQVQIVLTLLKAFDIRIYACYPRTTYTSLLSS